jgi:hypothetical protein
MERVIMAETRDAVKTLQFLIDHICADFTVNSLLGLARECVAKGQRAESDITKAILERDRTLDVKCAEGLAAGVVHFLAENGEVEVSGNVVSLKL